MPPSAHLACWRSSRTSMRPRWRMRQPLENGRPDRSAALAAVPKRRRAALRPARRDGRRRDEGRSERGGGADRGHVSSVTRRFSPTRTPEPLGCPIHGRPTTCVGCARAPLRQPTCGSTRPTPPSANTNNPIGLFATVAAWDGDALTVHDTTQHPHGVRDMLAIAFGVDPASVRVLVPFVGGAFGAGLRAWPHVTLAALAARITRRPVKLVLTRAQMFTSVGHRPNTIQQVSIGAGRDGQLTAIEHVSTSSIGMAGRVDQSDHALGPSTRTRAPMYRLAQPRFARASLIPGWMRASRRSRRLVRPGVGHRRALVRRWASIPSSCG